MNYLFLGVHAKSVIINGFLVQVVPKGVHDAKPGSISLVARERRK